MDDILIRLNGVQDSYYGFVVAVLTYVKKNRSRLEAVSSFMNENPEALSSDILKFISDRDDFYEDAAYTLVESGFGGAGADFLIEGRDQGLPEERNPL